MKRLQRIRRFLPVGFVLLAVIGYLAWPLSPLFPASYSRCIYDRNGILLQTTLAPDGQFRFRPSETRLPDKYVKALVAWEDRRFFGHPGIDPVAMTGAFYANFRRGERVRGGSTITMQLARLSHPSKRTYCRKLIECCAALRYSLHLSKQEQLKLYAAHVPMGGNIVGLESASYRYFGTPSEELTWAQAALFAVLPNAPSSITIVKKRDELKSKRDRLLALLMQRGCFDSLTLGAAVAERLPEPANRLPFHAPHFCRHLLGTGTDDNVQSSLDLQLQERVEEIVRQHHARLAATGIRNCAVLVAETKSGAVRAYIGSPSFFEAEASGQVDGVQAFRSPGSLLKPFLVACALDRGICTMESTLPDVPVFYGNFSPSNASRECKGAVPVRQMLIESLNIPAVRLLHEYGVEDFYDFLKKKAALGNLFRTADGYGLTLILGGLEASLWELCGLFGALADGGTAHSFTCSQLPTGTTRKVMSAGAAWLVLNTLNDVRRPESEFYRNFLGDNLRVGWKTGTSYGQKDAWAIGCNAHWIVGVWAGNFNSEGNALLGGAQSAGPVLFSVFRSLPEVNGPAWPQEPSYDLRPMAVCAESGLLPSENCPKSTGITIPSPAVLTRRCSIHKSFCVDRNMRHEVCSQCWRLNDTVWIVKAVYSPLVAEMLKKRGQRIDSIPSHNPACKAVTARTDVVIEYPTEGLELHVPKNYSGTFEKVICKAGTQRVSGRLFWFINNRFVGETVAEHSLALDLPQNSYRLTVQNEEGRMASVRFKVWRRER